VEAAVIERPAPVLNPGSIFTNSVRTCSPGALRDVLCVIEVHSCNGESQDGMRIRTTRDGTSYDTGAAFVLEPCVTHLVTT
jgi:hypothetical protein